MSTKRTGITSLVSAVLAAACSKAPPELMPPAATLPSAQPPAPQSSASPAPGALPTSAPAMPAPSPSYLRAPHFLFEQTPLAEFPDGPITNVKVSPDRTQVLFTFIHDLFPGGVVFGAPNSEYHAYLAPVGGASQRVEALDAAVGGQWLADGQALVYVQRLFKEFPGEWIDFDLPRTETLGYRLMRQPVAGGEALVLAEYGPEAAPVIFPNPKTNQVAVHMGGRAVGALWLVDAGGAAPVKLHDGAVYELLTWSPDGHRLGFVAKDPSGALPTEVRMVELLTPLRRAERAGPYTLLAWTADSTRLQLVDVRQRPLEPAPPQLHISTIPFAGGKVEERQADLNQPETGKAYQSLHVSACSPDGSRLVGTASLGGQSGETVVVDLGNLGTTVLGDRVELRGWFDDEHVMYKADRAPGVYTARVPRNLAPGIIPAVAIPRAVSTFVGLTLPARAKVGHPVPITLTFLAESACETPTAVYPFVDDYVRYVYLDGVITRRTDMGECPPATSYPNFTAYFTPKSVGTYRFPVEIDGRHARGAAAAMVRGLGGPEKVNFELQVTE